MDNEKHEGGILTMWWHSGTLTALWDACESQVEGRFHCILEMFLISSWWQLGSTANCSDENYVIPGMAKMTWNILRKKILDLILLWSWKHVNEHEKFQLVSKTSTSTENLTCISLSSFVLPQWCLCQKAFHNFAFSLHVSRKQAVAQPSFINLTLFSIFPILIWS